MEQLDGRVVLITGATRGIGAALCERLAGEGATVLVCGRDPADAEAVAAASPTDAGAPAEAGGRLRAVPVAVDVSDADSVAALARYVEEEVGRLDVLVNNAAAYVDWAETAGGADLGEARRVFDTNVFGTWAVTQALLPLLRASAHPRIVNVSSGGGSHGDEQFGLARRQGAAASYGISKAAVNALTVTLAAELADTPVLVNAVCPGLTATYPGAEAMGARPLADGVASVAWAALLPDDGPRGGFFRDGVPQPW